MRCIRQPLLKGEQKEATKSVESSTPFTSFCLPEMEENAADNSFSSKQISHVYLRPLLPFLSPEKTQRVVKYISRGGKTIVSFSHYASPPPKVVKIKENKTGMRRKW